LSERGSEEQFAGIESARVKLKLRGLIAREFVADELTITGARLNIVRYEDGRLNIDDLLKGEGGVPAFDIGRFALERSAIVYRDAASARRYELAQVDLVTGRVANNVATPVTLAFNARDGEESFQVEVALKGRLIFDLERELYAVQQASFQVKGQASGVRDLVLRAAGNFNIDLRAKQMSATQLSATIAGLAREEGIQARIEAPSLVIADKSHAEGLTLTLDATGPAGVTSIKLAAPRLTQAEDAIASESVALDVEAKRGEHTITVAIATPLEASVRSRTVLLKDLDANFAVSGPRLPGKKLAGALRGAASVDLAKEGVQVKLSGKFADSKVRAELTAAGFAAPVYTFAVDVDQVDLDRYSAPSSRRASPAAALDLSPLATLPASGTLNIGVLKSAGMKAAHERLVLK
jgi:AsmA protein